LVLLKITSPGVPDFYQGTELWDLSLVDPDNRRPVDFHQRVELLNELRKKDKKGAPALIQELLAHWQTGDIKLFITWKALNFRRSNLNLFLHGDYIPLAARGAQEQHLVAFARRHDSTWALAVAGRFFSKLSPPGQFPLGERVWGETALTLPPEAPREWHNLFTDETVISFSDSKSKALPLKQVLRDLPVALLYGRSV
jgi:(1->4)-alpha-D-glucan 1-alpha-D-glucosylmutase